MTSISITTIAIIITIVLRNNSYRSSRRRLVSIYITSGELDFLFMGLSRYIRTCHSVHSACTSGGVCRVLRQPTISL